MAIIAFSKNVVIDYKPVYGGNRKSDKPLIFRTRHISHSAAQDFRLYLTEQLSEVESSAERNRLARELQKKHFLDFAEGVDNYILDGEENTDLEVFYETADDALMAELLRAQLSSVMLSEGQVKN